MEAKNLPISKNEKQWATLLSQARSKEYKHSRGCARLALSKLFKVDPLTIPLSAPPGKAPILKDGWGHISISHCNDALTIGWSNNRLGIDIERQDRRFQYQKLLYRYFNQAE